MPAIVYIHEAGHMVIGNAIGITEQGVAFAGVKPGEAAQSWYSKIDHELTVKRSLAGLLAQIKILPDSIEGKLLEAYHTSIVFDEAHPADGSISSEDKEFLSGARDDLQIARSNAAAIVGGKPAEVVKYLRRIESEVRDLVDTKAGDICAVAADMEDWHKSENPEENPMMLYSPGRMLNVLTQDDSR